MANLNSQEANILSENFRELAKSINDFRFNNFNSLSKEENQNLDDLQESILNYGEDILARSTNLVMDDVQESLKTIKDVTTKIKNTVQTLKDFQKGINIATSIVTLGAAIINKNPQSILNAIEGVVGTLDA